MKSNSGCEFVFPIDFDVGLPVVPRGLVVKKPPGNGFYLLNHKTPQETPPPMDSSAMIDGRVALTAQWNDMK
jgi:hypothetical protein